MTKSDKQWLFLRKLALLIQFAEMQGWKLTGGELYRPEGLYKKVTTGEGGYTPYGLVGGLHGQRLAVDLNLFIKDSAGKWRYQRTTKAHEPLGLFWESLGGSWGGRFAKPDGNHYSEAHQGVR